MKLKKLNLPYALRLVTLAMFSLMAASPQAQTESASVNSEVKRPKVNVQYHSLPQVVPEQAQMVYYYPKEINAGPLYVYVDKAFHTALLPGQFTVMCVATGEHAFSTAINDAPDYKNKLNSLFKAKFKGGMTYFVKMDSAGTPVTNSAVSRQDAESDLASLQRQVKLINRSSTVQACQYIGGATAGTTLVQDSLLFKFGGSDYQALLPESRNRLNEILNILKKSGKINAIRITGFTDGIGSSDTNTRLSQARADTVRQVLVRAGIASHLITAEGGGVAQSANGCTAKASRQADGCNKMSRRAEIMIDGQ